jgi:hypothetical protein
MNINSISLYCVFAGYAMMSAGCSANRLTRDVVPVRAFDINLMALSGPVTVKLNDGRVVDDIAHFNVARDTAMWTDESGIQPMYASIASIRSIHIKDQVSGYAWGALGGYAVGFATSFVGGERDASRVEAYALGGCLVGGLVGYLVGVPVAFELVDVK